MTNLTPINGHLLIEPIKHEGFMASQNDSYEEIGVVISNGELAPIGFELIPEKGDKVFFDSFLAAKYPKESGEGYYWLVKYEDIRALIRNSDA